MENRKIRIENAVITVPSKTKMNIAEIADLFGVYYHTAKKHIRAIEKLGVAGGDYSGSCTVEGSKIYPDYYGLEMLIAVTFRVQSPNADIFRRWLLDKISLNNKLQLFLSSDSFSLN